MRLISACESDWLHVVEDSDSLDVLPDTDVRSPRLGRQFAGVITLTEARAIVSLKSQKIVDDTGLRGKGAVDEQKWAKLYDGSMQLGRYVGQISVGEVCIEIKPKIERLRSFERVVVPFAPFVLFNTRKESADSVPTVGYEAGGALNGSFFDYFASAYIRQLSMEFSNGLRSGYEELDAEVPSLRGRVLYSKVPMVTLLRPHLLPCRFDNFSQDTLHNRVIKQALGILIRRIFSPELRRVGEELYAQMANISDANYDWSDIMDLEPDRLQARYAELIKHAKLTIRSHFAFIGSMDAGTNSASHGFVMIWDVERLYEIHAYKVLSHLIEEDSGLELLGKCNDYYLATNSAGKGAFNLEPDLILRDDQGKVILIIDTKWKNFEEKGVVTSDAYQMMAYAQCMRKDLGDNSPPVVLLYPSKDYASQADNEKNTYVFTNLKSNLLIRFIPLCLPVDGDGLIDYFSTDLDRVLGPDIVSLFKVKAHGRRKRRIR